MGICGSKRVSKKADEVKENYELGDLLMEIPLLRPLSDAIRARIGGCLKQESFKENEVVISQGDIGKKFYLIANGSYRVEVNGNKIAELSGGDYFGEKALINSSKRGATVVASEAGMCYTLEREIFVRLFSKELKVHFGKRRAIVDVRTSLEDKEERDTKKSSQVCEMLRDAILNKPVISASLIKKDLEQFIECMWKRETADGEKIIIEGDYGDCFYVLGSGTVRIQKTKEDGSTSFEIEKNRGDSFGELALLHHCHRKATVISKGKCVLWCISRKAFRGIIFNHRQKNREKLLTFIKSIELLAPLLGSERKRLIDVVEERNFDEKTVIVEEGDKGTEFFMIMEGQAIVTKEKSSGSTTLGPGGYFGEIALLTDEPRKATVTAKTKLKCMVVDRKEFLTVLGPLKEILERKIVQYPESIEKAKVGFLTPLQQFKLTEFTTIGYLGRGAFGKVDLVKRQDTYYALKQLWKSQVVETHQQHHVMDEKRVLRAVHSDFVINLISTINSKDRLYFVLEYLPGGDFFNFLKSNRALDEHDSRFYIGCVVLALEDLHSKGFVYRDLKPENLMMDKDGYLKLIDFGFAKQLKVREKTFTLCGTPDYLAPEIICGRGHGFGVDFWGLGILIFETLASYCPFYDSDQMITYQKILRGSVKFPDHFSPEAMDLIHSLLAKKATKRIGISGGFEELKKHSWFRGFDWKGLRERKLKAPLPVPEAVLDMVSQKIQGSSVEYQDSSGWDDLF